LVKLSWRAAASKQTNAVVLGILRRMYGNLTYRVCKMGFLCVSE
jgi:hypothetical protein